MNRQPLYRMTTFEGDVYVLHIHFSDKLRMDHFNENLYPSSPRIVGSNELPELRAAIIYGRIKRVYVHRAVRDENGVLHEDDEVTLLDGVAFSSLNEYDSLMDEARMLGPNNMATEEKSVLIKTVAFTGATILEW